MQIVTESSYPISFRKADAINLGKHLHNHRSVVLIGMKRVGINNFLRFFLNHSTIAKTYIKNGQCNLFIRIDLNDLVERDIYPFWTLTLKRLVDAVEESSLSEKTKRACRRHFSESIQLKDLFVTVDSVRKVVYSVVEAGYCPILFFIRFDRMETAATAQFLANLYSLIDAAERKLSYVFTSFRPLHQLVPDVFTKQALSSFSHNMYLKPASVQDTKIILKTYQKRYNLKLTDTTISELINLSGSHVQYIHLAVAKLQAVKKRPKTAKEMFTLLSSDEEITLICEELFENLTNEEKEVLLKIKEGKFVSEENKKKSAYLWNTGMIVTSGKKTTIFSPLFDLYLEKISKQNNNREEFTKKEHLLFSFLKSKEGYLCEREDIIQAVWPEQAEMGVSDWAVDRLISRVRAKLKRQNSQYEIVTVITRGYKLVKK